MWWRRSSIATAPSRWCVDDRREPIVPIVTVTMMEGREPEKIERMIAAISEAIAASLDAPIETVRVMVYEQKHHQYGVGGKPMRVVLEERRRGDST